MADKAVLLLAYGGPDSLNDVPDYLADVLSQTGRTPTPEMIGESVRRYEMIGGKSPLREIAESAARKLQAQTGIPVYVGMRHWKPYIQDVVVRMAADGIRQMTAICMAPHYSAMSIGEYRKKLDDAVDRLDDPIEVAFIDQWYNQPHYLGGIAANIQAALSRFPAGAPVKVVFTAHSLPAAILERGDPYDAQLKATAQLLAERSGLPGGRWTFAYQSAPTSRIPWLGPDLITELLPALAAEGEKNVLVAPVGFISEHLEILYDLDIAARQEAEGLGIHLERTPMLNDSDALVMALADLSTQQQSVAQ